MKRVFWAVGVVLFLALTILILGMFLPSEHTVTQNRTVTGGPEAVWRVMTTVEDFPMWRDDVDRVEVGSPRGGMMWTEHSASGPVTYRVVESAPFHRWTVEIADEDLGFGGSWTWELISRPSGTVVNLTEMGVVHSPLMRVVSYVFMDEREAIDRYLDALESRMAAGG